MEPGFIFAIGTAAAFALSQVMVRRATYQSDESFTALAVSLLIGTPLFMILLTVFDEWPDFTSFTWPQYVSLCSAGLVHLIIARYLFFNSTRLLGANPTVAITRTSIVFSIVFGVVFPGIDNWAHAGGFVGGYATAFVIGRLPGAEGLGTYVAAGLCLLATVGAFLLQAVVMLSAL